MRKSHIAGFTAVGASVLMSAGAIAGPPSFHYQSRGVDVRLRTQGCDYPTGGYRCHQLEAYASYDVAEKSGYGWLTLYEYASDGTVSTQRTLECPIRHDILKVLGDARSAELDTLIDIAADGCSAYGYRVDYSTGEYGPYEFPNNLSIRARLGNAFATYSGMSTGQSTQEGSRLNVSCQEDGGERFQDVSVEIDGESSTVSDYSEAHRSSCNYVGKL